MARDSLGTETFSGTLANWTQWFPAWGSCTIDGATSKLQFGGGTAMMGLKYSGAGSINDNQYIEGAISNLGFSGDSQRAGFAVRMAGADGTRDAYFARVQDNGSSDRLFQLGICLDGDEDEILDSDTFAFTNNDILGIEVEGSVITVYLEGVPILTATDIRLTTGVFGIVGINGVPRVDDVDYGNMVAGGPTITTQPDDVSLTEPAPADFTVAATGTGTLTYQWQEDSGAGFADITDGGIYAGAETDTLTIDPTDVALSGNFYRCNVTDDNGTTASDPATLTVGAAPGTLPLSTRRFGAFVGSALSDFAAEASEGYVVQVFADLDELAPPLFTSGVLTTDADGFLADIVDAAIAPSTNYCIVATRQSDRKRVVTTLTSEA
jgi:hypothetical protein